MCDHCGCREFPPIAELTAEHEEILDLAWSVAEAERTGDTLPPGHLDALDRLLGAHVVKEETGLYPLLTAEGDLSADLLTSLEEEHREIAAALASASFGRKEYFALAAHIETEETELFPFAMFGFGDEQWESMVSAHRLAETGSQGIR